MTSKHTPGPWTIGSDGYNANTVYSVNDGVCQMYGVPMNTSVNDVGERYAVGMANARLISAAPDMYEALKRLLKWVEPIAGDNRDGVAEAEELASVEMARAALSKAEGGGQ